MNTDTELITLIQELKNAVERLSEKQDEMNADIKQIKEAVYNPDSGLYARLRDLEQWKETYSKVTWGVLTTVVGLVTATVYKMIIGP